MTTNSTIEIHFYGPGNDILSRFLRWCSVLLGRGQPRFTHVAVSLTEFPVGTGDDPMVFHYTLGTAEWASRHDVEEWASETVTKTIPVADSVAAFWVLHALSNATTGTSLRGLCHIVTQARRGMQLGNRQICTDVIPLAMGLNIPQVPLTPDELFSIVDTYGEV